MLSTIKQPNKPDQPELLILKNALVGNNQTGCSEDLSGRGRRDLMSPTRYTKSPKKKEYLARSRQPRKIWYAFHQ
jgi:hypothetical protein